MKRVLWLISLVLLASCHAQTQAQTPILKTTFRWTTLLFNTFTIVMVEQPAYSRVRCADQVAQKSFRDIRSLYEIVYNWRMTQPGLYYDISASECACEGYAEYEIEQRSTEVIIHCKKSS